MSIFFIRGCSGSGKSTLARMMMESYDYKHIEADNYFINDNGVYKFNPDELASAHLLALNLFRKEIYHRGNKAEVIVSNTFTTFKELKKYNDILYNFNIENVTILEPQTKWWKDRDANALINKNVHMVPPQVILNQLQRYQPLDAKTYLVKDLFKILV